MSAHACDSIFSALCPGRLKAMTGAAGFLRDNAAGAVSFRVPRCKPGVGRHVKVAATPSGYRLTFTRVTKPPLRTVDDIGKPSVITETHSVDVLTAAHILGEFSRVTGLAVQL